MKLIEPKVELLSEIGISQESHIARCARVCYIEGTEILTNNGFKLFKEIDNDKDLVLTYNQKINKLEWNKPNSFSENYDGDIINFNHKQIKFAVTPNHRVVCSDPYKREFKFKTAEEVYTELTTSSKKTISFRFPKFFRNAFLDNTDYTGEIKDKVEINAGSGKVGYEEISLPINSDFIDLMGAFISEGHSCDNTGKGYGSYCQITQDENHELYQITINALENLGIRYSVCSDPRKRSIKWIRFGNYAFVKTFDNLFGKGSHNIHLPEWFRNLSYKQKERLLYVLLLGDGSHNTKEEQHYITASKKLAEQIQELYIQLGSNSYYLHHSGSNDCLNVYKSLRDSWVIKPINVSKSHYEGKVYCTQTDNGIVCVRYKGCISWCGNCYGKEYKEPNQEADEKMVNGLIKRGHLSMLRHASIYLTDVNNLPEKMKYLAYISPYYNYYNNYASTNLQAFRALKNTIIFDKDDKDKIIALDTSIFLEECKKQPKLFSTFRLTFCITTQIATSRELNRVSPNNIAERSTRYCSSKDGLEICKPWWFNTTSDNISALDITKLPVDEKIFAMSWKEAESSYNKAIELGMKPEDARGLLPLDTATKVIYTYSIREWQHILDLRLYDKTGPAHPNVHVVMQMVKDQINNFAKEHNINYQV